MKLQANNPCCICSSLDSHGLFAVKFQNHNYPGTFYIRKCNGCGLLFNSPRLPDEDFPEIYQGSYYFHKRNNQDEFARIIRMYCRTTALVSETIQNKEVFEIGSAKGYLLTVMKKLGWKVQGLDISAIAADFAKRKLKVPTEQGMLEDYVKKTREEKRTFPLVLAIDVIEHVLYPKQFIEDVSEIVAAGGTLIIDTPNGNAANIVSQGEKWKGFNPFHIFFFSVDNLTSLLAEYGFVVEKAFSYGNDDLKQGNCNRQAASVDKPSGFNPKHAVKQMLKKIGLFDLGVSAYHLYEKLYDNLLKIHISKACREIQKRQTYFQTPDSEGPYAENYRGDNLVIISRKTSG